MSSSRGHKARHERGRGLLAVKLLEDIMTLMEELLMAVMKEKKEVVSEEGRLELQEGERK